MFFYFNLTLFLFKFFENNNIVIKELSNYYIKSCQNKLLNQLSISNDICCKNIILDLEKLKMKIKTQYIDNRNKCKYIEINNSGTNILIPVKPSGISYNYPFESVVNNNRLSNLKETMKNLGNMDKKLNKIDGEHLTVYSSSNNCLLMLFNYCLLVFFSFVQL